MRDLRDLPIGELLIVILAAAVAATFAGVFVLMRGGSEAAEGEGVVVATPTPPAASGPAPAGGASTVEMDDNFFVFQGQRQPDIEVKAGEQATVGLVNNGKAIHNMRITGADDKYDTKDDFVSDPEVIKGGAKGALAFKLDKAGTFKFRCDFHPQEMTGTVTVQ